jgi:Dynein heavy chain, N-terminal region 2
MQNEVTNLSSSLKLLGSTLDEYITLQRAWMHLEPIFKAHDIQRQLPAESRQFTAIDKKFKKVVHAVSDRPNVMHSFTGQALLDSLRECNESMEQIQVRQPCMHVAMHRAPHCVSFLAHHVLRCTSCPQIVSQSLRNSHLSWLQADQMFNRQLLTMLVTWTRTCY